jgi:N-formylglutamate amidohydrolase
VAHIPHASTLIPYAVRAQIRLDDVELARELVRLTDWHTDRLYGFVANLGASQLINGLSRLVVDPERFVDDAAEPMARVGQGVVYSLTRDGRPLRSSDEPGRQVLIERYFIPYHEAFSALVADTLDHFGRCLILDCHSFSTEPLPSEPDQTPDRPDICLGTDAFHTPPVLTEALRTALVAEGFRVETNRPFAGAIVPLRWYQCDRRIASVMLETRRGLYCDESTGLPSGSLGRVAVALERGVRAALVAAVLW